MTENTIKILLHFRIIYHRSTTIMNYELIGISIPSSSILPTNSNILCNYSPSNNPPLPPVVQKTLPFPRFENFYTPRMCFRFSLSLFRFIIIQLIKRYIDAFEWKPKRDARLYTLILAQPSSDTLLDRLGMLDQFTPSVSPRSKKFILIYSGQYFIG